MKFKIEHLKFVEDSPQSRVMRLPQRSPCEDANEHPKGRYVTFASAPLSQSCSIRKEWHCVRETSFSQKEEALDTFEFDRRDVFEDQEEL